MVKTFDYLYLNKDTNKEIVITCIKYKRQVFVHAITKVAAATLSNLTQSLLQVRVNLLPNGVVRTYQLWGAITLKEVE